MNNNRLSIRDLVTIGVFAVVYFAIMFVIGFMGIVPILFLIYPFVLGIFSAVVVMLFMAKVQKPWALLILGMISPLIMFVMGHTIVLPALSLISMLIAEFARKKGNYSSFSCNAVAMGFYNTWICGSMMQMLLAKEKYMQFHLMMGEEYFNILEKLISYPSMGLIYLGAFAGGIIGAFIGKIFLKKHFEKAGIIL